MLRVVQPRDPKRKPDVLVPQSAPRPSPFATTLPSGEDFAAGAEIVLEQFDAATENTPITAVHPWQRQAPPPLPQDSEEG